MILTKEELEKLMVLTPEVIEWLKSHPMSPLPDLPLALKFRLVMSFVDKQIEQVFPKSEDGIVELEQKVLVRDGHESTMRVTRPEHKSKDGGPLFVWLYGGGYVGGAVCCAPAYRLGPANLFPHAPNDVFDNLKWIASHAEELGADPKLGVIVKGVSAGGNLATVTVRRAHVEEPLAHPTTSQWLECPYVFPESQLIPEQYRSAFLSREQGTKTPFVNSEDMAKTPDIIKWDPNSTLMSPANYAQDYKDMPRAYFYIYGVDLMREDGLIYDEMLKADGVETKVDIYSGCPHAHILFMPDTAIAKKGVIDGMHGAAFLLGRQVTTEEILAAAPKLNAPVEKAVDEVTEKIAAVNVDSEVKHA